jgi:hypothetical protein
LLKSSFDDSDIIKSQRKKLIDSEENGWESHSNLERGKRKAKEMEKISFDIMLNLDNQTNQIKNVRGNIIQMNSEADKSDSILNRILRRENRNKLYILAFSITIILVFILLLSLFKFN